MEFRSDINGLRGLAVLLVLLFHFGTPGFGGGFVGVDLFFVISGFLMTGIILRGVDAGTFSLAGFYRARLERLYPALLALVAGTLGFGAIFIEPVTFAAMARDGMSALAFASNVLSWRQAGYFGAAPDAMWFLHSWSLAVEWQFYLAYPIVLLAASRVIRNRRGWIAVLSAGFVMSLALSVVAGALVDSAKVVSFGFYMLPTRAWEMIAGGLVAVAPCALTPATARMKSIASHVGLAAIAVSVAVASDEMAWPSWQALLPVAGTMAVLAAARSGGLLATAPLQVAGRWSYSIYLWHWPVVAALAYFGFDGGMPRSIGFGVSILLGWVSYRFIEQPSLAWLRGPRTAPRPPSSALAAVAMASAAVMALAVPVAVSGGFPERAAPSDVYARSLEAAADYTYPLDRCGGMSALHGALRPCELGRSSGRGDVLVIGDSFAEMWYPRLAAREDRLAGHGVTFLTMGGCPPIVGLTRVWPGMACEKFVGQAMEAARDPRYGTVVLAGMWSSYFTRENANSRMCDADGCVDSGSEAGLQRASAALGATARELRRLGKRLVVFSTSPYPGVDVPTELRKRAFAGGSVEADWHFDFDAVLARSQPINSALNDLRLYGAEIVDPVRAVCGEAPCLAAAGGEARYSDAAHLRSAYVATAGDFIDRYLIGEAVAQAR